MKFIFSFLFVVIGHLSLFGMEDYQVMFDNVDCLPTHVVSAPIFVVKDLPEPYIAYHANGSLFFRYEPVEGFPEYFIDNIWNQYIYRDSSPTSIDAESQCEVFYPELSSIETQSSREQPLLVSCESQYCEDDFAVQAVVNQQRTTQRWADMDDDLSDEDSISGYTTCSSMHDLQVQNLEYGIPVTGCYDCGSSFCNVLKKETRDIRNISFSPSGKFLLTGTFFESFKICDGITGSSLANFRSDLERPMGHIVSDQDGKLSVLIESAKVNYPHVSYCYNDKSKFLLKKDYTVDVFCLREKIIRLKGRLKNKSAKIEKVLFLANEKQIIIGYSSFVDKKVINRIDVHDIYSGTKFTLCDDIYLETREVTFLSSFVFNEDMFFFIKYKNEISLWNITKGEKVFTRKIDGKDLTIHANSGCSEFFYVKYNLDGKGFVERCSSLTGDVCIRIEVGELKNVSISNFGFISFVCKEDEKKVFVGNMFNKNFFVLNHLCNVVKVVFSPSGLSCAILANGESYLWNLFDMPEYKSILPKKVVSFIEDNYTNRKYSQPITLHLIEDTVLARRR